MINMIKKSVAIIGEGETEWFYFDSLRQICRYPFKVLPDMPQHSDILHIAKLAEKYASKGFDYVICLVDMDRLISHPKEMASYLKIKSDSPENVIWIETTPCTEFWFLLHFLPEGVVKHYQSYEQLLPELQKFMPGYEKTTRYFRRIKLYAFLKENGDLERASKNADRLLQLSREFPEQHIAYSEIHRVLQLLAEINESGPENPTKSQKRKRIGKIQQDLLDFLASNSDSDVKSISRGIGLRPSRTRDIIKELLVEDLIREVPGSWPKRFAIPSE